MRNLALLNKKRKGKGKVPNKKGNSEGEASQSRKKKDSSKIKCFVCHKNGHYASQCAEKKGKGKMQQLATSVETQLSEFAAKFQSDFFLVSSLSTNIITKSA